MKRYCPAYQFWAWLVVAVLVVVPTAGSGQHWLRDYTRHTLANWAPHGLMFTAGLSNGISDGLQHKYDRTIFARDPQNGAFWDPDISYRRKYRAWPDDRRPAYPGARTWLAWTTDGWHLTKTAQLKAMQGAVITYRPERERRRWWWPLADLAISSVLFSAGFHVSQAIIIE